jgi:regulator of replication initiation timing
MSNQAKTKLNRATIKNQRLKLENKLLKAKLALLQEIEKKVARDIGQKS